MRVLTLAVLAVLALAGCSVGAQVTGPVATPEPTVDERERTADWSIGTPVPDEVDDSEIGTVFDDRPDIVGASATMFESWSEVDDHTVAVHFVTGTPQCYGAHASVEETESTVTVTLLTGALPEAADKMCILVAVFGSLDVPLSRPLGDRHVVNG